MIAITLIPDSGLFDGSTAVTLRIATVIPAVLVVRKEEAEVDEFRPEPESEEVEDARLRGTVGPKTIRCD